MSQTNIDSKAKSLFLNRNLLAGKEEEEEEEKWNDDDKPQIRETGAGNCSGVLLALPATSAPPQTDAHEFLGRSDASGPLTRGPWPRTVLEHAWCEASGPLSRGPWPRTLDCTDCMGKGMAPAHTRESDALASTYSVLDTS